MDYFLDSSALVKRYVAERGSDWVNAILDPSAGSLVHCAALTPLEVTAAIRRRQRGGSIAADQAVLILSRLGADENTYFLTAALSEPLIAEARRLADRHGLRALDAVQLGTALSIFAEATAVGLPLTLASADLELNAAAVREGMPVVNPEDYP